jgi:diacylglycerol kinase family enzyme
MQMEDTWYVVINPSAGNGRAKNTWDALRIELDRLSVKYIAAVSAHRGHITELAHRAGNDGYSRFISVGGDGTHHELINGLLSYHTRADLPVVAIINAGTGNDWSRTHKIPDDVRHCAELIVKGNTIDHAAGLISYTSDHETKQRYFMNVAGMALDGRVVEKFPPSLSRIPFLPGYLIAGLRQLATYSAPDIVIETISSLIDFSQCMRVSADIQAAVCNSYLMRILLQRIWRSRVFVISQYQDCLEIFIGCI